MATGVRVLQDLVQTTLSGAHTATTTTLTLAAKLTGPQGDVPTLTAGKYFPLTIKHDTSPELSETVHVTAYTAGATTCTVQRGQEGTTARAWSGGEQVYIALTKQAIDDRILGDFSGVTVRRTSVQSVGTTFTDVVWSQAQFDTDGYWAAATPASIIIPRTGYYRVDARVHTNSAEAHIYVTGFGAYGGTSRNSSAAPTFASVSGVALLTAGTEVKLQVARQTTGNIHGDTSSYTEMSVTRVRGTAADGAFVGAKARRIAELMLTAEAWTAFAMDTEDFDSSGFWASTPNADRFTVPTGAAGYYAVGFHVEYDGNPAATASGLEVRARVNGSTVIIQTGTTGEAATTRHGPSGSTIVYLNAGDYITFDVYNHHNTASISLDSPHDGAWIHKLGQALTGKLDDLSDVAIATTPTTDVALGFNTSTQRWEPRQASANPTIGINTDGTVVTKSSSGIVGTSLTMANAPAGVYSIDLKFSFQAMVASGGFALHANSNGGSSTVLMQAPAHTAHNSLVHTLSGSYLHTGGDLVASLYFTHEGNDVTFGYAGDSRWGRQFRAVGPLGTGGNTISFVGASVANTTDSPSLTGPQKIPLDAVKFESHSGMFDNANDRIVIPAGQGGKYLVTANVNPLTNSDTAIRVNNVNRLATTGQYAQGVSGILDLAAGDYIELWLQAGTGVVYQGTSDLVDAELSVTKLGHANHTHKAEADTDWKVVGAAGQPAFQNSWVNFDAVNYESAGFRKTAEGLVVLRGVIKSGTVGEVPVFTLPAGYRPGKAAFYNATSSSTALTQLRITDTGEVRVIAGNGPVWVSLAGTTFFAEQ